MIIYKKEHPEWVRRYESESNPKVLDVVFKILFFIPYPIFEQLDPDIR
jgi:hypothetical protein